MNRFPPVYPAGTYKVLKDTLLLLWDQSWADEYLSFCSSPGVEIPSKYPVGWELKEGQEVTIAYGKHRLLVKSAIEGSFNVSALDVTVHVGSKTHRGIILTYDENFPSIVQVHCSLRPVKKRGTAKSV